jgi:uncharacterized protein involved in tolerance to divalent cations
MKKDKELGASTDAGEVGTLAVSLTGLATRRVARTTVSPSAAPGLTDGSNMAKAVVTRDVAGCRSMWIHDSSYDNPSRTVRLTPVNSNFPKTHEFWGMLAQSRGIVQVLCILKTQTQNVQNMVKTGQSAQNVPVSALITHVECQFWYGQEF